MQTSVASTAQASVPTRRHWLDGGGSEVDLMRSPSSDSQPRVLAPEVKDGFLPSGGFRSGPNPWLRFSRSDQVADFGAVMDMNLVTSLLAMRQTMTRDTISMSMIKKQHELDMSLVDMLTEAIQSTPPPGQGGSGRQDGLIFRAARRRRPAVRHPFIRPAPAPIRVHARAERQTHVRHAGRPVDGRQTPKVRLRATDGDQGIDDAVRRRREFHSAGPCRMASSQPSASTSTVDGRPRATPVFLRRSKASKARIAEDRQIGKPASARKPCALSMASPPVSRLIGTKRRTSSL